MKLKLFYSSREEIPEQFIDLYEDVGGTWRLTGVEGMKTQEDINKIQGALDKERRDHKIAADQLKAVIGNRTAEEVLADLDRIPELETIASGKLDDEKINSIVESRIKTKVSPLERELNQAKTKAAEAEQRIAEFETKERQRTIHDIVRSAASKAKVVDTAMEDVLMIAERVFEIGDDGSVTAKDGMGVTPGVAPEVWLTEMTQKRPHWWPASQGGGAKGGGSGGGFAQNPWHADNWNLTKQGEAIRTMGREKAEQMAKAAGSYIGAMKPVVKK